MKKILFLLITILLLTACSKVETKKETKPKKVEKTEPITETYQDTNNTPISFYELKGNTLTKVNSLSNNYQPLDDISLLQVYPSNEDNITLQDSFGTSFYNTWNSYNTNNNLKIGFSLTYNINNEEVYYPILTPSNTMDHWEYFMAYLYDDYINQGKSSYSHIENDEYQASTLFTSFKLQLGAYGPNITKPVSLTVFTYDSEDDFLDGKYRGNSKSTITICLHGTC